jgi:cell wall assembly regulator SMI1
MNMQDQWERIERRLGALGCVAEMKLRPGAPRERIAAAEHVLGLHFPESLRHFLAIRDGQDGHGLVFGQKLLPVDDIRKQWEVWRSIDEAGMNADCAEFMRSSPEGHVKAMYCNPAWIPITHDGSGNHIGVDLDPDVRGQVGQIIAFGRDEDVKRVLAPTFEHLADLLVAWLERATWNGKYLEGEGDD